MKKETKNGLKAVISFWAQLILLCTVPMLLYTVDYIYCILYLIAMVLTCVVMISIHIYKNNQ